MLPLPIYDPETLKPNILRAYNTAQTIIRETVEFDHKTDFLLHAPHFYFRGLICAACTICKVVRSTYKDLIDRKQIDEAAANIIAVVKRSIIMEGDLATRLLGRKQFLQPPRPSVVRGHFSFQRRAFAPETQLEDHENLPW